MKAKQGKLTLCSRGHKFYKSSGTPTCPVCWPGRYKNKKLKDGARCLVVGGTHVGKSGTVRDINTSKTGAVTITVLQNNGERFKTLAKNVEIK